MDRRQIATILVLKDLGIEPRMKSFDNRLSVQKAIYLSQIAGADLGYYFGWYLHGPYCRHTTQEVFSTLDDPVGTQEAKERWSLDKNTLGTLKKVREIMGVPTHQRAGFPNNERGKARWLELLASVHFLIDRKQVRHNGPKDIKERLKTFNKDFKVEEVKTAIQKLRNYGFIKPA